MKTKLIILLLLLSGTLLSQELPDLKSYSKDIGFNTNFLLNGLINSNGSPFDLMLKTQRSSNTAIRYGAQLFTDISANSFQSSSSYQKRHYYSFSISVGKERQHQLNKHWIFYYGGDLAPFFLSYRDSYYYTNQLNNDNLNREGGLRVSPFLGIRFQINDRLYVATEAVLRLSYSRKETYWRSYDNTSALISDTSQKYNNIRLQALPATGISVFYRF